MANTLRILYIYIFLLFCRTILSIRYIKHVDLGIGLKQNLFIMHQPQGQSSLLTLPRVLGSQIYVTLPGENDLNFNKTRDQ